MRVVLQSRDAADGTEYRSLTVGRAYEVLGIEGDWYRLLDDTGEPILFDPTCFDVVDPREPGFWVSELGEEGERYAYPPEWNAPGFFERWHDGVEPVHRAFAEQLAQRYPGLGRTV